MSAPPPGLVERVDGEGPGAPLLWWTLDRPLQRNAIAPQVLDWIGERSRELAGEVVILRGAGEDAFCAGFDLGALAEEGGDAPDRSLIAATTAIDAAAATFIAAVNGYAIGAGVELAAACDFRVASPAASFRVPAGRLGVVYHARGLARIHGVFGSSLAHRLFLAGETITAAEARDAGALDEIIPPSELDRRARELASRIAALAPLSVAGNRRILRALVCGVPTATQLAEHERARSTAYASDDHAEARRALAERRPPNFRGR